MDLTNKIALVTGGSQGIGKAVCLKLAQLGANIAVNYIDFGNNKAIAEETQKELEALGVKAMIVSADVSSFEDTEKMFAEVMEKFGRIDILVNNAGITKDNLMMRMKEADFDAVINVNLKGTWNCMKHVTRIMMKQKYGKIISMASVVGVMGNAGQVNYSASKAGVIGMTMSLARELASRGINVNAVAPGFIQTDMTAVLSDEVKADLAKNIPLGTLGTVEDVANTVAFLASDESKYITGQVIHVDGGMAM
ncbi:3-oxoacyl-[acyl-carrier-protein] reductase [Beduini massiliensis]|uniref:3-oxoacyl-[acyl-carrier-protein] reductase n=1 Tax=Beduini massiliensis TaxID=1585974 RepID=UPI00059AB0CE|nr:3-oxoacyl-[acyl-carrier-protein] reductase [Beduini massiliensis]